MVQLECWFRWFFCIPFSPLQFEVSPTGTPENPSSLSMVGKKPVILCRHSYLKSAFSLSESLNRLNMQQHTMWLLVENPYVACSLRKQPTLRDATASLSPRRLKLIPKEILVSDHFFGWSTIREVRLDWILLYGYFPHSFTGITWMYNHGWGTFARLLKYGAVYSLMK